MAYNRRALFELIEERLSQNPRTRLQDLAAELRVDRHTLVRAVRENTGQNFRKHKTAKTLGRAFQLLLDCPEMSIKEIALTIGYLDIASFGRVVKDATGKPPTVHRKGVGPE